MGREVRRVPLDFDWPLNEVWSGYLPPDEFSFPACPACTFEELPTLIGQMFPSAPMGSGYTREAYAIAQSFYPHMIGGQMAERLAWCDKLGQKEVDFLVAEGRLRDFSSRWNPETRGWEPTGSPVLAKTVNAANGRGRSSLSAHDAINRSLLVQFRCEQLGIMEFCPACEGHGTTATAEQRQAADDWTGTDPPEGEGWQLWETTSEGSPISPVFATGDELARWIADNPVGFVGKAVTLDAAMSWVHGAAWAPSMVGTSDGRIVDGITAFAERAS